MGSVPGSGRSPGGGNGSPPQCSWLESPVNRGAWQAAAQKTAEHQTQLSAQAQQEGWAVRSLTCLCPCATWVCFQLPERRQTARKIHFVGCLVGGMGKRIYSLLNKLVMVLSFDSLRKRSLGVILILRPVSGHGTTFSWIFMSEKEKSFRDHPAQQVLRNRLSAAISAKYKKRSQPVDIWQVSRITFSTEMPFACCVIASSSHLLPKFFTDVEERGTVGNDCLVIPWCFHTFVYNQLYTVKVYFFTFILFMTIQNEKYCFSLTSSECDISFYVNGFYYPPYGGVLLIFLIYILDTTGPQSSSSP